ncbi:Cystathionine gamma-lyase [Blattella germanica]|nr:Cystathionine gamma-lyase [Blattella germanica]
MSEEGFLTQNPSFATRAIHEGQEPEKWNSRAVVPPITLSTTFKHDAPSQHSGYFYSRCGNPSRDVLQTCLASLDEAKYGLCFSSGLGATTAVVEILKAGDHMISSVDIYGGTFQHFNEIERKSNIETTFIDATDPCNVEKAIKKNTKLVWIETPTNPLLKIVDINKISEIVHKHNLLLAVDNTFLTPYFQRPLNLGADIVVYSLTKYMNGHSDVVMGAVTTNNEEIYTRLQFLQEYLGIVPSPFDCYLVNRSLKTLHVRMREHMKNGLAVARYLEKQPLVQKVIHPALPSHPQHLLAKSQSYGHSGMLTFFIKGGREETALFLKSLKVFTLAESLGGFESLAGLPSVMSHGNLTAEQRVKAGITDNLVRLAVGLESAEDLIADLDHAFDVLKASLK